MRKIKMWYNRKERKRFLRRLREDVVCCLIVFVSLIGSLMMFEVLI
jgi:hypothetical protein